MLAAAIFCILEKHLFDETTSRTDVANSFDIMATQLHKAVTGIDYRSGPHAYKRKQKTMDTASTGAKIQKTESAPSAVPSTSAQGEEETNHQKNLKRILHVQQYHQQIRYPQEVRILSLTSSSNNS